MEPTLAEIVMFAGNFAPRGWAFCHGQLLPINSNQALFSLLGTIYGGDGRTTFALPDLRGRVPVSAGHGAGLPNIQQGAKGGSDNRELYVTKGQAAEAGRSTPTSVVTNITPTNIPRSPYQGINYIICLQGLFPSRS